MPDLTKRKLRERLNALREQVRASAENRPGVYRMIGPSGEVLYVGKSVRVRTRLLSYFRAGPGEKAAEIMGHTHRLEWDYTPSEFAALIEELRSIKRWRPLYNVEHKRDRAYGFIKITREAAPRLQLVGQVAEDQATYYGPFRGRARLRDALRTLSDVLELRDCKSSIPMRFADQIELFGRSDSPLCMRGDLGRCLAPCAGRCTLAEYLARIDAARRFLEGDADGPLRTLRDRMFAAAERLQFEYAAELRDRAARLEQIRDELVALRGTVDALTFVYVVPGWNGEDRWYVIRRGGIRAELPAPRTEPEYEHAIRRVEAIFAEPESSTASVAPHQVAEILLVARWFRFRPGEAARTIRPEALGAARLSA